METPKLIRHLAFARPPPTGDFTDFTARYGALQEEDRLSFRQTLSALHPTPSAEEIEEVAKVMKIHHLLDLPSVSLSSGQTRRARIAAAILTKPVLLLLEDPMAGLDVGSREEVSRTLGELNARGDIRIALVQRGKGKGDVPDWITDVCEVREGNVWVGPRSDWEGTREDVIVDRQDTTLDQVEGSSRDPVVRLQDVFVSYGEGTRPVSHIIS
jgi:energy-coupling factor transporter ATP-binding protein EcfA2